MTTTAPQPCEAFCTTSTAVPRTTTAATSRSQLRRGAFCLVHTPRGERTTWRNPSIPLTAAIQTSTGGSASVTHQGSQRSAAWRDCLASYRRYWVRGQNTHGKRLGTAVSHNTVLSEPVLRRPRIIQWFAARPRIVNVLVTLACTVPTVTALVLVPPAHAWLGYLCAAGVAVAFWWRRPRPLPVLLIVVGLAALNPISGASSSVAVFESLFGVYTLASLARLRTAILGYLLSEAVIFAVAGVALLLGFRETLPAVLLQPTASIALAIGVAVRASRARRSALEDLVAMREERAAAVERARITAEMHDVVAHSVTVMIALAGGARAELVKLSV